MNISYQLNLVCSQCQASVTLAGSDTRDDMFVARKLGKQYQAGQPQPKIKWRLDGSIIKQLNEAKRWVAENPVYDWNPALNPKLPPNVGWVMNGLNHASTYVKPKEYRFVDCPACGGRVYMDSGRRNDSSVSG